MLIGRDNSLNLRSGQWPTGLVCSGM